MDGLGLLAGTEPRPYVGRARRVWLPGAIKEQRMTTPRIDPDPLSPLNQMQRYLVHEFVEDYQDGLLSRRDLTAKIGYIAGGTAAATAILSRFGIDEMTASAQEASTPQATEAQSPNSVAEDDPAVATQEITFPSGDVEYTAYEARPAAGADSSPMAEASPAAGGSGLVLVCHENRGLTPHIQDVARLWPRWVMSPVRSICSVLRAAPRPCPIRRR
jgi:hypothetical protein